MQEYLLSSFGLLNILTDSKHNRTPENLLYQHEKSIDQLYSTCVDKGFIDYDLLVDDSSFKKASDLRKKILENSLPDLSVEVHPLTILLANSMTHESRLRVDIVETDFLKSNKAESYLAEFFGV
tara:strand:- start:1 stop:372 length:372 start_codon:yes stop_codon:yes gene_type:complete